MGVSNVRAVYFPYCLERQEDGSWVILNRNYKPVGFNTDDHIEYENYPVAMKQRISEATLRKLSFRGGADEVDAAIKRGRVYLYNDGTVPTHDAASMQAYLKRVEILLKLKAPVSGI